VVVSETEISPTVVWHDLECGAYRADLPLWRELAEEARRGERGATVLDVGAGSGRVALDLTRAGHRVSALDSDEELLAALQRRAGGDAPEIIRADARDFALSRLDYDLCIVPMQTIQLLGGSDGRALFLRCAHAHLRPGALLACAIVTELEPFDAELEGRGPSPELKRVGEDLYVSRALSVRVNRQRVRIERERTITHEPDSGEGRLRARERNIIELDRLSALRLRREGLQAGLKDAGTRTVAATSEHVGSTVVMLRA
jgi:SAM-dependent methyltransferase